MPETVAEVYEEAGEIAQSSPRAASALLRLCVEMLLVELNLGDPRDDLFTRIGKAFADGDMGPSIKKAADVVRVTGNDAIHPGVIAREDDDATAATLFTLVNMICHRLITEPRQLEAAYSAIPKGKLDGIEKRDRGNTPES